MTTSQKNTDTVTPAMSKKKAIIIGLSILLAAAGITLLIFLTEPKAIREGASKETAMLVEVTEVRRGNYFPQLIATGTVVPENDIILSSQVSGEIIKRAEEFTPGRFVKKGQLLVKIDPADYQYALAMRKSELHKAEADLELEMGRQKVARQDLELLDDSIANQNKNLILRRPQLKTAQAQVEAAEAAVAKADLNLARTSVRAPFDAQIINRNVNLGSQVSAGDNLGRLVGVDRYWVRVNLPLSRLKWLYFPDADHEVGSPVKIRNRTAWKEDEFREAYLFKLVGALEEKTRLANVLVSVPDPLARKPENKGKPSLIIGEFMEVQIMAQEIKDVFRIERNYIRNNQTVWLMKDKALHIQPVDIVMMDAEYAYITAGLENGDKIVNTNLSTVVNGAPLRTESDSITKN